MGNKKILFVISFAFAVALDLFFWPMVSACDGGQSYLSCTKILEPNGTIPAQREIYLPSIQSKIQFNGDPSAVALSAEDAPWHKTVFSSTASPPDYKYAVTIYENLEISQTQNFQLASEVFVLHNNQDAKDGYDGLQLSEGVTQTLTGFDDEAILTTISKDGVTKEVVKFRRANVVVVVVCQGLGSVYKADMVMLASVKVRDRIR